MSHNPWASSVREQHAASQAPIRVQEDTDAGVLRFFVPGLPGLGQATHETSKIRVTRAHAEAAGSPEHRVETPSGSPSGPQIALLGLLVLVLVLAVIL